MTTDDVPHLPKTVSWREVRESLAWRRECRVQAKLDPDEGKLYDQIQARIAAERKSQRGNRR